MMQVYLSSNGQRTGPHSLETIKSWLQSGEINLTSPAWFEGCSSWVTVADIPGVQLHRESQALSFSAEKPPVQLHISRDGSNFGPYSVLQAAEFLRAGQLLPTDYAMVVGHTQWKNLQDLLTELNPPVASNVTYSPVTSSNAPSPKTKQSISSQSRSKSVKVKGLNQNASQYKVKEKSLLSKLIATCVVFLVTFLVVGGSTLGAYLIAPMQVGPVARKFGVPIDKWFPGRELDNVEIVEAPPGRLQDIRIGKEQWHHINSSGIKLLPIDGDVGLQVISSIDEKLAMNDDDLKVLLLIAQHLVILDLTKSAVTDEGLAVLKKFPNLQKLTLEGSTKITTEGVRHLAEISSLEKLNLVRVKLDDSAVDFLSTMKGLREVYLYQTQLSDEAIQRLKDARPQMFVNAG